MHGVPSGPLPSGESAVHAACHKTKPEARLALQKCLRLCDAAASLLWPAVLHYPIVRQRPKTLAVDLHPLHGNIEPPSRHGADVNWPQIAARR